MYWFLIILIRSWKLAKWFIFKDLCLMIRTKARRSNFKNACLEIITHNDYFVIFNWNIKFIADMPEVLRQVIYIKLTLRIFMQPGGKFWILNSSRSSLRKLYRLDENFGRFLNSTIWCLILLEYHLFLFLCDVVVSKLRPTSFEIKVYCTFGAHCISFAKYLKNLWRNQWNLWRVDKHMYVVLKF